MPSKTATPKRPAKPRKSIAEKALELRKLKADTEKSEIDLDEARDAAGTRGLNRRKLEIEAEVAELELQQERAFSVPKCCRVPKSVAAVSQAG